MYICIYIHAYVHTHTHTHMYVYMIVASLAILPASGRYDEKPTRINSRILFSSSSFNEFRTEANDFSKLKSLHIKQG